MIRLAEAKDIENIARTYTELLQYEEANGSHSNWKLNVYPTIAVSQSKVPTGTMYVLEENGEICASMVLNQEQAPEYGAVPWQYAAESRPGLLSESCDRKPQCI